MQACDCRVGQATPYPRSMELIRYYEFASDAARLAMTGAGFLVLAAVASLMERRRIKRVEINRVGWVPWTGLFLASAVIGGGLIVLALPGLLGR